jgi:hypothetical protein
MTPLSVYPASREPEHTSFQTAVAASQRGSRAIAATETTHLISATIIQEVRFTDITLDLLLKNGLTLSIYLANSTVCWSLQPVVLTDEWIGPDELPPAVLPLLFAHLPDPYRWKRSEVALSLEGQELIRVCAGETWMSIDVKKRPTLMFLCLKIDDDRQLLYFDPE